MKARHTIALLVILGGLVAALLLIDQIPRADKGNVESPLVLDLKADEIISIQVTDNQDHLSAKVSREAGGTWRVDKPFPRDSADDRRLNTLASQMASLRAGRVIEGQDVDLDAFGLAPPSFTARLELAGGEVQVLHMGKETPQRSEFYVQPEGRPEVYLVRQSYVLELRRLIAEPPFPPTPTSTAGTSAARASAACQRV